MMRTSIWFAPFIKENDQKLPVGSQKRRRLSAHISGNHIFTYSKNSCTSAIVMMKPTQDWEGDNLAACALCWHWTSFRLWDLLLDALMWPDSIEVLNVGGEHAVELLLMQDEQVIETLASHTTEKPFTDGIRSRGVIRGFENLNITRLRNSREAHPKLAIIITDEVLRPLAIGGGFPKLLCGPSVGRTSCDADVDHSARFQFDNEEGEQGAEKQVGD
jgi:hypothetical protein